MVVKRKLSCGSTNGFDFPNIPKAPRSSRVKIRLLLFLFVFSVFCFVYNSSLMTCGICFRGKYQVRELMMMMMMTVRSVLLICSLLLLESCWKKVKVLQRLPMDPKGIIMII